MKPFRYFVTLLVLGVLVAACAAPQAPAPVGGPTVEQPPTQPLPSPTPALSAVSRVPTATVVVPLERPTAIVAAMPARETLPGPPNPAVDPLLHPWRLSYAPEFDLAGLVAFLEAQPGPLKNARFQVGNRSQSFAEVLIGLSSLYSFNPQVILALIESRSGLLSAAQPTADQLNWALGYQGDGGGRRGLYAQLRWGSLQIRQAIRDYALAAGGPLPPLTFADGSEQELAANTSMSRYVLARLVAPTVAPGRLDAALDRFLAVYIRLFGDPRRMPTNWPAPAAPFLTRPMDQIAPVTSFFDHDTPFLQKNGSLLTYWGRAETDLAFAYDGHTGWDYAMAPPDRVLAAADGTVIFAGNSDDGCATPARAVIIDHGNGYRSLYWHLASIAVEAGRPVERGEPLGVAGESGCVTGPHLHFQVQFLGRDVDPYGWCGAEPDRWATNPAGQVSTWLWLDMPSPCHPPPPGVIVVDDDSAGFRASGDWQRSPIGYAGGASYIATMRGPLAGRPFVVRDLARPAVALWQPELPHAGRYRVLAYVPYALNGLDDARDMRFLISHSQGLNEVVTDAQDDRNWWVDLGTYAFDPADRPFVSTSALAADDRLGVWADAVAFVPVE